MGGLLKQAAYVGVAGAFGAVLRMVIGQIIGSSSGFPVATLAVNSIGTFLLCFIVAKVAGNWTIQENSKVALQTGFLGSFTTFSAFSMETVHLFEAGQYVLAVLYVSASIVCGLGVALVGFLLGRKRRV